MSYGPLSDQMRAGDCIRRIREMAQALTADMAKLSRNAESISRIMGTLTAEQLAVLSMASGKGDVAVEEINQNVARINAISREAVRAMEDTTLAVSALAEQARLLALRIGAMKF